MSINGNNNGNGGGNRFNGGNGHSGTGNVNATVKREPLGNLFVAGEGCGGGGPDPKRIRR
jgi:hypothetical protein